MPSVPAICESASGVILFADGLSPVYRWDGYSDQLTEAGVAAPTQSLTVSYSGTPSVDRTTAPIAGIYRAFVRFVDRFGNFSNFGPVSGDLDTTVIVVVPPAETGETVGVPTIVYQGVPVPDENATEVVRRQILRNTTGQATAYYVDVDTDDLTARTFSSVRADDELGSQEVQAMLSSSGDALYNRFDRPPSTMNMLEPHRGRVFGAGSVPYEGGTVTVTNGSPAVQGSGTSWLTGWVGRSFLIPGEDRPYTIAFVSAGGLSLLLTENYQGSTADEQSYVIVPPRSNNSTVYYSESLLPEAWPPRNSFMVNESGGDIKAIFSLSSFLYIAKRNRMFRLTADIDIATDGIVFDSVPRGCVSPRAWAKLDGAAYVLDEQGIYLFDGDQAVPVSNVIRDVFQPTARSRFSINWSMAQYFHAVADPSTQGVVRFFVTINGGGLPRWAICYCPARTAWWLENYPYPVGASCQSPSLTGYQAGYFPLVAGRSATIWRLGSTDQDGTGAWQPIYRGSVVSSYALRTTLPGDPGSVVGMPITIVSGRGAYQTRVIVAVTSAVVTLDRPWGVWPDATSIYAIGGIPYQYETDRVVLASSESRTEFSVSVGYETQLQGSVQLSLYQNNNTVPDRLASDLTPVDGDGVTGLKGESGVSISLKMPTGYAKFRADRHLDGNTAGLRTTRVRLDGVSGPSRHTLNLLQVLGSDPGQ